jgi:hypothetical protein
MLKENKDAKFNLTWRGQNQNYRYFPTSKSVAIEMEISFQESFPTDVTNCQDPQISSPEYANDLLNHF